MAETPDRRAAGPAPDLDSLQEAALTYLARYAATEAGLRRVLQRRIDRWTRRAEDSGVESVADQASTARSSVHEVIQRLITSGVLNDVAYADARAHSLVRAGRSRRAVALHLAAKGIDPDTAQSALAPHDGSELAAALVLARRRRIGPFRSGAAPDEAGRRRELGVLARAGFPQSVARQALAMDADQAETLVNQLRR